VYASVLSLATVLLRLWFRVRIFGVEHIPPSGPAIIAPNHKNFFDVFFVGMATRRRVRSMAKIELFKGPLGWLLLRVGAFPVRRGEADAEAIETAAAILAHGGLVVMFPEGTRVERRDALGSPHHGAGRLALQTGVPIIPAAITGTAHLWRGAVPKTKRVQLAFLPAIASEPASDDHDAAAQLIDELVWPAVQEGYGSLRDRPGLIAACVAAIGIGGGLLAKRRHTIRSKPELLGTVQPRRLRRRRRRRHR
jgi:1-acyl-sn-glycerol-3-phosphate acyltransferase